jgi:hypothetical protein
VVAAQVRTKILRVRSAPARIPRFTAHGARADDAAALASILLLLEA